MKITLHPLFIVLGLASAIFGGLPVFIIYALTALLHECGHIFCAYRLGFVCEKISLMPYGASAICDTEGISRADEIKLALSGPLVNALICIATAGLWWFYPQSYAYTDTVFYASAAMFIVNLMPAYPLDGGRIARCILLNFAPEKVTSIILRVTGGLLSVTCIIIFFFAYRHITFIVFAVFLFCSAFEKPQPMLRIGFSSKKPRKGKEIKHIMLSSQSTYKDALKYVDGGKYLIFQFYSDGLLEEITQDELFEQLQSKSIYDRIIE